MFLAVIDRNGDVWEILKEIYDYMKLIIPIIIIVMSSVDFLIAIAKDDEQMKKAQTKFIKRLVVGILFLLVPTLLDLVFSWTSSWSTPIDQVNLT